VARTVEVLAFGAFRDTAARKQERADDSTRKDLQELGYTSEDPAAGLTVLAFCEFPDVVAELSSSESSSSSDSDSESSDSESEDE
jgi:hypothetical protein